MSFDATCMQFYGQRTEPMVGLGQYSDWDRHDIIERLQPLLMRGWAIDPGTGKITPPRLSTPWQSPWWHHASATTKKCTLWHRIMFEHWGMIPSGCQECWKTVVRPRTLVELFQLRELEKKLDLPSKCGIEVRGYTPAHYGGYFYANSLDQGREYYKIVREAVSEDISPDVKVILKRGCTEMELKPGIPSVAWRLTKEQLDLEEYIEARIDVDPMLDAKAPDYVDNRLKKRWVHWAFSNADETYKEFTGGKTLHTPPVVYHDTDDIETMKRDIQVLRGTTVGLKPEHAASTYDKMKALMRETGINEVQAGALLGYSHKNPLHDLNSIVDLRGEEDQTT